MVKDYTKAARPLARRGSWRLGLLTSILALAVLSAGNLPSATRPPAQSSAGFDFSDWHFPVPAGAWLISRGPCGARGMYTHQCGYYEDECAFDLTPVDGSMLNVPVLAPQAGRVFFLGTRIDSGLAVFLQHADGRVSALMHLSKVVVGPDQPVAQGQVVGYAGATGSSTKPHLHFDVQQNAVERTCLPLYGIDEVDSRLMTLRSHNLAWQDLVLPDPPMNLPAWLPLQSGGVQAPAVLLPRLVELAPAAQADVPIAVAGAFLGNQSVYYAGRPLLATASVNGYVLFTVHVTAPADPGDYQGSLDFHVAGPVTGAPSLTLNYRVRTPMDSRAGAGLVWINPRPVSPPAYSAFPAPPALCFTEPAVAGPAPLTFRIIVAGPVQADSGWMAATCWTPPPLPRGTYYWKVFVRDGQGHMNRTNQRPVVFRIQ